MRILERLLAANGETMPGYGSDLYCEQAKEKIRTACACPEAEIYFLVGGTQTNAAVIGTMLPAYAGVIAAQSGHVNTHEAGAIECTGHKVLTCPSHNGKLDPGEVRAYAEQFYADQNREHMVYPGMVYIPIRQNTVHCIQNRNWKNYRRSAASTIWSYMRTEHGLAMDWQRSRRM